MQLGLEDSLAIFITINPTLHIPAHTVDKKLRFWTPWSLLSHPISGFKKEEEVHQSCVKLTLICIFAELAQVQEEDVTNLQETEDLEGEKPGLSSLPGVSFVSGGSL